MHSTPLVTEKRPFQVNTKWPGLHTVAVGRTLRGLDRVGQALQRRVSVIERCGDRRGKVCGHAVTRQKLSQARQLGSRGQHDIESRATMNVDIDEPGNDHRVTEVDHGDVARSIAARPGGDGGDRPVFNEKKRTLDFLERRVKAAGSEYRLHGRWWLQQ